MNPNTPRPAVTVTRAAVPTHRLLAVIEAAVPVLVSLLLIVGALTAAVIYLDSPGPEPIAAAPITPTADVECAMFCTPPDTTAPTPPATHVGCVMFCTPPDAAAPTPAPAPPGPSPVLSAAAAVITGFGRI
ncbi:hypothetical protein [Nocardia paucivorans]|uniref:hypothetical protein n=1 Tax=Nocardia paucivorans TaxID=114259 RepID=UPI0002EB9BA3|nr:hypothetical protein [Nocardia paucivorans]